ncbi:unannotated protein [freshwater metagenome]|uniref:Unannotated protein n=1 Tax=freshwater metagenome TaxID=449393 RepID=A0A6J5Y9Z2_9ZZZZ
MRGGEARSGVDRPPTDDTTPVQALAGHFPQGLCDRRHSIGQARQCKAHCQQLLGENRGTDSRAVQRQVGHDQQPRSIMTSRSTAGRSVMIPSTPRSRRRCISIGSSIVQTWTSSEHEWARSMNRRSTSVTPAVVTGTWTHRPPGWRRPSPKLDARSFATPFGPSDVQRSGPRMEAIRSILRSENDPIHTRSTAPKSISISASGSTTASCFGSMFTRRSGQVVRSSDNSGMGSRPSTSAVRISAQVRFSITPTPSVTRSRRSS